MPKAPHDMTLQEITYFMSSAEAGSVRHGAMLGELTRRLTIAQLEAVEIQKSASRAQEEAANAAKETAEYTRKNATYMLYSVVVLAVSVIASIAIPLLARH